MSLLLREKGFPAELADFTRLDKLGFDTGSKERKEWFTRFLQQDAPTIGKVVEKIDKGYFDDDLSKIIRFQDEQGTMPQALIDAAYRRQDELATQ
ncbi:MAG TPA: hypothetical protein VLH19_02110 [Patescibacteria group bacterium]|nr:hypothetical protein [Patescibacteria group bacterium]